MRKLLNLFYNFHWIVPGEAARSAQPYLGMMGPFLEKNGIKAVINLRGHHPTFPWWIYENQTCARLGVAHFDAMMDSKRLPLKEMLVALFDAFDAAPKPFLVKCSGGQDRTSLAAALYIVHRRGWGARDDALKQFARFPYLHFPKDHQRWLRMFLDYAHCQACGRALGEWIRCGYDPQAFAEWLEHGTFNGIWEPWKPPSK
jgi:protein tyrosine/serine phosphatase